MVLKVLGSGSSGNCYILESDTEALIIEAGVPFKEVKVALGFNVKKIAGVIVSHEHKDHSKYIAEYERAGIKIFKPYEDYYMKRQYGKFKVYPFTLVHDVPCFGFYITEPSMGSCMYASDTSYIKYRFKSLNNILIEANHIQENVDRNLPQYEHILRGHMSLDTTLKFLMFNDNPALRNVVLLHLSDNNADSAQFLQKTRETVKYGADCYIASSGLSVDLNLCPF